MRSMILVRRDDEIYRKDGGWFSARWHFSFDQYRDPANMGWGLLRVFNDDRLVPGAVWPLHPHRDIEGLTYVVEGTFRHEDDLGNDGVIPAGSAQRMTLGRGARHSEQNASQTEPMRFIQMWIMPAERGLPPSVEQKVFTTAERTDRLLEIISPKGGDACLVHQDASVYVSQLRPNVEVTLDLGPTDGAYLYVIVGRVTVKGVQQADALNTGDAAKIKDESQIAIRAQDTTELILVRVPMGDR
jgi:redox-sensitive bicupin YhaK (pirin superfamily)